MRKLLLLLGLIAYIYGGLVTVDVGQKYQMIRGIGGINLPDWV